MVENDWASACRGCLSGPKDADDGREDRKKDNHRNYVVNVVADVGDEMPKRVAAENRSAHPERASKDIEKQVARVGHSCGARDRGAKGSNDRNESRENDSPTAIFLVEIMGSLKMTAPEKERVFATVKRGPSRAANPITDLVARDGAKHYGQQKPLQRYDASIGKYAGRNEEGVTGEKKPDKETGFYEDNGTYKRSAARPNQFSKSVCAIERVEKVEDGLEQAGRFLERFI